MLVVIQYIEAVTEWVAAGRPTRSDAEIADIVRIFCKPCSFYYRGSCRECHCHVRESGPVLLNKVAMATQHCPRGKW